MAIYEMKENVSIMSEHGKMIAVLIGIVLSLCILMASFVLLLVSGALLVYMTLFLSSHGFCMFFVSVAMVCFILSGVCSGKGIAFAREYVYRGVWDMDVSKKSYNGQALLFLLGVFILFRGIICM